MPRAANWPGPALVGSMLLIILWKQNTSISPADSLDSSVHQKAASLLNPAGHCYSGPALSDGSLRIVELMTNSHKTEQ